MTRALWTVIAAGALSLCACETAGPTQAADAAVERPERAADGRRILYLNPMQREHITTEMRGFLTGVQQVSEGLAQQDRKKISTAAAAMGPRQGGGQGRDAGRQGEGQGQGAGMGPGPGGGMPPEFHEMGRSLHLGFADIAAMAETAEMREIQAAFAANLARCSTCHSTFTARDAM